MLARRPTKLRSQRDINLWRIPLQLSLAAVALFAITLVPDVLCRSQDALNALNQAVLQVLPFDPHRKVLPLTLTTDNGTQFTSTRYLETLRQLGITHRRTAYNHPEGNGRIERFHRSLKEEEVWLHEYQSLAEARDSIARWIHQYNHQRPHQALHYRTPAAARQAFHQPQPLTKIEALSV